jgi:hypothetical protein
LSDFKGKVVVLEWTNHQCPFVRKHYESDNMQKTQEAIQKILERSQRLLEEQLAALQKKEADLGF